MVLVRLFAYGLPIGNPAYHPFTVTTAREDDFYQYTNKRWLYVSVEWTTIEASLIKLSGQMTPKKPLSDTVDSISKSRLLLLLDHVVPMLINVLYTPISEHHIC